MELGKYDLVSLILMNNSLNRFSFRLFSQAFENTQAHEMCSRTTKRGFLSFRSSITITITWILKMIRKQPAYKKKPQQQRRTNWFASTILSTIFHLAMFSKLIAISTQTFLLMWCFFMMYSFAFKANGSISFFYSWVYQCICLYSCLIT